MRFLLHLLSLVLIVAIIFACYLVGLVIELLPEIVQDVLLVVGFVAGVIAANIHEYRSAYVKGKGKPWHFWLFFLTTIAFALLMLSLALHDMIT